MMLAMAKRLPLRLPFHASDSPPSPASTGPWMDDCKGLGLIHQIHIGYQVWLMVKSVALGERIHIFQGLKVFHRFWKEKLNFYFFFDTDIFVIAIDLFAFSMICNVIFTHSSMQRPNIHSPQAPIKNPPSLPKLQGPRTIETNGKGLVWHWHQYKRAPCFGHTSTPNHLSLIAPCSW